ncbi:MAG: NAD(P)-dependent oxidoreductase [Synergistaceae bacterium]|nr:NAD(P)-dependent oxidoreductase [Synergistaceae bacterium]
MKKLIITGASGLVGTELVYTVLNNSNYSLFLISTHPDILKEKYKSNSQITSLSIDELERKTENEFDCIVHLAFARSKDPEQLAKSLDYTRKILTIAKHIRIPSYINISSQSIYGDIHRPLWEEQMNAAPNYLYALGKYATELMTQLALQGTNTNWTNIRLASVIENARFVSVFVRNMIEGKPLNIVGGSQKCSFIDVQDVANAIYKVITMQDKIMYKEVYNLGTGIQTPIVEIANLVNRIGHEEYSLPLTSINIEQKDIHLDVGMDNRLFMKEFNWKPLYSIDDMIRSLFELHTGGHS